MVTTKQLDTEMLRKRFYVDSTSPSGLRMRIDNAARYTKTIRKKHDAAGYVTHDTRRNPRWEIGIGNITLKVSRIIWIITYGEIPDGMVVDHKDGNPLNNTLTNLQILSNAQNLRALNGKYRCNSSGYLGVFHRPNNSWFSAMRRNGKLHFLGNFSNPKIAARAYNQAVAKWAKEHGETPRYLNPV